MKEKRTRFSAVHFGVTREAETFGSHLHDFLNLLFAVWRKKSGVAHFDKAMRQPHGAKSGAGITRG